MTLSGTAFSFWRISAMRATSGLCIGRACSMAFIFAYMIGSPSGGLNGVKIDVGNRAGGDKRIERRDRIEGGVVFGGAACGFLQRVAAAQGGFELEPGGRQFAELDGAVAGQNVEPGGGEARRLRPPLRCLATQQAVAELMD